VATTLLRYLFQSWVRDSEGGKAGRFEPIAERGGRAGAEWMEMEATRWLEALAGVRRSKTPQGGVAGDGGEDGGAVGGEGGAVGAGVRWRVRIEEGRAGDHCVNV